MGPPDDRCASRPLMGLKERCEKLTRSRGECGLSGARKPPALSPSAIREATEGSSSAQENACLDVLDALGSVSGAKIREGAQTARVDVMTITPPGSRVPRPASKAPMTRKYHHGRPFECSNACRGRRDRVQRGARSVGCALDAENKE